MIRTEKEDLDSKEILKLIETHKKGLSRLQKLENYYKGLHSITEGTKDTEKPDNRLVNSYPKYIVDMHVGYLVGNPVSYSAVEATEASIGGLSLNEGTNGSGDTEMLLNELTELYDYNDEQSLNSELATTAGKLGIAYELQYIDSLNNIRLTEISPLESFVVYDNTLENNIKFFMRYYAIDKDVLIDVYTAKEIISYKQIDGAEELTPIGRRPHAFNDVPVSVYSNNKSGLGDFEPVMALIDAYDRAQSDTMNDMDQFTDSYLALHGAENTDPEDITRMKKDRVLLLPEGANASWLIKSVNDTWVENFKMRIRQDIHKFSSTPDLSDTEFGGNMSGVSLSYKLLPFENARKNKARKFKVGLQRRMELICNYLNFTKRANYDYTGIDVRFNNTLPQNVFELSQTLLNLSTFASKETLVGQIPFVENPKAELEKRAAELDDEIPSSIDMAFQNSGDGIDGEE
ncbi:portal protein [Andreesenia angusta]|uniref:Portal protein n=1 Tax=Andreesenia angusta TaxID=39480 RepID=A0A1S1V6D2_9FIRM|nr:phage portal protein [Andreesenia angusta]OHW62178.1 portal protein [Andreesenia angusta]